MSYKIAVLDNCKSEDRFKAWKDSGGTLLGQKSIGCGINSLTFLGIFDQNIGNNLVTQIC